MCVHSLDGGEFRLHSPLLVELQLFVFVIRAAYFSAAKRDPPVKQRPMTEVQD